MSGRMLLHDRRLEGNPPSIAENTYQVDANTSTRHMVDWVGTYARGRGGLDELIIMCHGYYDHLSFSGLQLGDSNLTITNGVLTTAWNPSIRKIYLYSCGAGDEGFMGPAESGRRFCSDLAGWTGANVYAADALQWYRLERSLMQRIFGTNQAGTINFRSWEGQVYRFSPEGTITAVTLAAQPTSR